MVKNEGIKVVIGEENPQPGLKELSIVSSMYKAGEKTVGLIGIVGPKSMEYSRMMALVEYISKVITDLRISQ